MADQTALDCLDRQLLKIARRSIGRDENVHVVLVGNAGQALIALDDRVLVLKAGVLAGFPLGGKATSFPYEQISGVEVKAGLLNAVLEIRSSALPGVQAGGFWSNDKAHDPWKLPNCVTASRFTTRQWGPHLEAIRGRIARGAWRSASSPIMRESSSAPMPAPEQGDLASQLVQLAALKDTGALSAEEFERAKKRLLG